MFVLFSILSVFFLTSLSYADSVSFILSAPATSEFTTLPSFENVEITSADRSASIKTVNSASTMVITNSYPTGYDFSITLSGLPTGLGLEFDPDGSGTTYSAIPLSEGTDIDIITAETGDLTVTPSLTITGITSATAFDATLVTLTLTLDASV